MASQELTGTTALVTGASRGFGRAVTVALHEAGADVVAVARNAEQLGELRDELGGSLTTVTADAADPVVAGSLLEQHQPKTLVLNAGASPLMRPIQHHTWDTFNRNWEVDVRQAFHWIREALLLPLARQSTVITPLRRPTQPERLGIDCREQLGAVNAELKAVSHRTSARLGVPQDRVATRKRRHDEWSRILQPASTSRRTYVRACARQTSPPRAPARLRSPRCDASLWLPTIGRR